MGDDRNRCDWGRRCKNRDLRSVGSQLENVEKIESVLEQDVGGGGSEGGG